MIDAKTWNSLSQSENAKRRELLYDLHKAEDELRDCQIELRNLQDTIKKVQDHKKECKAALTNRPFRLLKIPTWQEPSYYDRAIDFPLATKAYAYSLYYKEHEKALAKRISKCKIEVKSVQRVKDSAQNVLRKFDEEMKVKYNGSSEGAEND